MPFLPAPVKCTGADVDKGKWTVCAMSPGLQ